MGSYTFYLQGVVDRFGHLGIGETLTGEDNIPFFTSIYRLQYTEILLFCNDAKLFFGSVPCFGIAGLLMWKPNRRE